ENEIAQSESAHAGHPFARVWMHNEMLTVDGVKMSKSLGNITTVRDILTTAPGEAIRLALLMTHYRDPLDWTAQKLAQARAALDRWYRALSLFSVESPITPSPPPWYLKGGAERAGVRWGHLPLGPPHPPWRIALGHPLRPKGRRGN